MERTKPLKMLISSVITDLELRNYSPLAIYDHRKVFNRLRRYCESINATEYTERTGQQFIEHVKKCNPLMSRFTLYGYTGSIKRMNCSLNDSPWRPRAVPKRDYAKSCYDSIVIEYENYLIRAGKTRKFLRSSTLVVADFLAFAESRGCTQLEGLTVEVILAGFEQSTSKTRFRQAVGAFLQYAYKRKMTKPNLKLLIPSVVRRQGVPSVYSPEEVEQLLASIDRTTVLGKRDYAILLIAARLGLRASDIANLKFSNLKAGKIEIFQAKTKQPLTTVLSDEIKESIFDYVDHGRQQSDETRIFLNRGGFGAVSPCTIGDVTRRAIVKSGINRRDRKSGSHSLRASLATALLSEGNDYPTIQKVLGQENIQSTKFYAKADIDHLRTHAIPVPPPSGNFAALLRGEARVQ